MAKPSNTVVTVTPEDEVPNESDLLVVIQDQIRDQTGRLNRLKRSMADLNLTKNMMIPPEIKSMLASLGEFVECYYTNNIEALKSIGRGQDSDQGQGQSSGEGQ